MILINSIGKLQIILCSFSNLQIGENNLISIQQAELVNINGCSFSTNQISSGYLIFSSLSRININGSTFTMNVVNTKNQNGGLIRTGSNFNISNTLFLKNVVNNTSLICSAND